jgi:hypothetical protein
VLALAAWAAFAALRLTTQENSRLRAERQLQPRRELILDVVRELKELAAQVETVTPGVGYFDVSALAARKHRLRVALEFFQPGDLPKTEEAADPSDLTQSTARAAVQPAATELAAVVNRLESPVYGLSADSRLPWKKKAPA